MEMISRSHIGLVRSSNEDFVCVDPAHGVAVLADGMGGLAHGEVASREAAELVCERLVESDRGKWDLVRAFEGADHHVFSLNESNPSRKVMGTTLAAVCVHPGFAWIAHVGDSRVYWFGGGVLECLTTDHTVVQERVERGEISSTQALLEPDRHVLTQAVGLGEPVDVPVMRMDCVAGDLLLLCSDGLTDMLPDEDIVSLLATHRLSPDTPEEALGRLADQLVEAALEAGGYDNVSLALVEI